MTVIDLLYRFYYSILYTFARANNQLSGELKRDHSPWSNMQKGMEAKFIPVNGGDAMRQLVSSLHRHRHLYFQYWIFVKFTHKSELLHYIYIKRQKQTLGNSKVSITVVKFRERRRDTEPSLLGWHSCSAVVRTTAPYAPLTSVNDKRNKFISCNKLLFLVSFLCRRSNWSRADSDNVNWKCFLCRNPRNYRMTY